jgi:acylphosphatase
VDQGAADEGSLTHRWLVTGRVQGVGYRAFIRREADLLGLSGWVANLADGRVTVVAAGAQTALDALDLRIRRGPRHSEVEAVLRSEISDESLPSKTFVVRELQ